VRDAALVFEEHRARVRAVAYRMLGSVADAEDVALMGVAGKREPVGAGELRAVTLNGSPGFVYRDPEGALETLELELDDGRVTALYIIRNPDKLVHLRRSLA